MGALAAEHLSELLEELRGAAIGLAVREVQPLPPRDALLVLDEGQERVLRLRLSADPEAPRIHLQNGRVHRHDGSVGPWFERAAALLGGATLSAIEQPRADRIALLRFTDGADDEHPRPILIAELTGRHANLILCDGRERVLATLIDPPRTKHEPRLVAGEPGQPPPGRPRPADRPGPLAESLPSAPTEGPDAPRKIHGALSWQVEHALGSEAETVRRERALKSLRQRLERKLARSRSLVAGLEQKAEASAQAERVRMDGELLKAALGELKRGQKSIELPDWFVDDAPPRQIALDPKLGPRENVERIFDRYHKLLRGAGEIEREQGLASARVERIEALLLRAAAEDADPDQIEQDAVDAKLLEPLVKERAKRVQKAAPRLPYRTFRGKNGGEILVGRNARDNDELTMRIARGNDLWLHTADSPGSHVVLRVPKGTEPHQEDVLDAAHLAAHFSPLSRSPRVAVHTVRRKQIRKPKGAPPGTVQLAGGKVRQIRIEADRLERLLKPERH